MRALRVNKARNCGSEAYGYVLFTVSRLAVPDPGKCSENEVIADSQGVNLSKVQGSRCMFLMKQKGTTSFCLYE